MEISQFFTMCSFPKNIFCKACANILVLDLRFQWVMPNKELIERVTRLGEFSHFVDNCRSSPHLRYLFPLLRLCINFETERVGIHYGRFFTSSPGQRSLGSLFQKPVLTIIPTVFTGKLGSVPQAVFRIAKCFSFQTSRFLKLCCWSATQYFDWKIAKHDKSANKIAKQMLWKNVCLSCPSGHTVFAKSRLDNVSDRGLFRSARSLWQPQT
jgi:hypothetical protein